MTDQMFTVRFLKGTEREGYKFIGDQHSPTKRAAIAAIRKAGAKHGPKFLDSGRRIRTALIPAGG